MFIGLEELMLGAGGDGHGVDVVAFVLVNYM